MSRPSQIIGSKPKTAFIGFTALRDKQVPKLHQFLTMGSVTLAVVLKQFGSLQYAIGFFLIEVIYQKSGELVGRFLVTCINRSFLGNTNYRVQPNMLVFF